MTKIFSPSKPSAPPPAPAPAPVSQAAPAAAPGAAQTAPTVDDAKVVQQEQDQVDRKRGRASTILTGPAGDTSKPKLGASTALGY